MSDQNIDIDNIIDDTLSQNKRLLELLSDEEKNRLTEVIKARVFTNWDPEKSSLENRVPFIARQEGYNAYTQKLAKQYNLPAASISIARKALKKSKNSRDLSDDELDLLRRTRQNRIRCSIENVKKAIQIIKEAEH